MKWIAAMSLCCADIHRACVETLLNLGVSRLVLNVYDTHTCHYFNDTRIITTHFSGMKGHFWWRALGSVEAFDYVWLVDSDVCPYTPQFSLSAVERWFDHANAGVLQPSIVRTSVTSRDTDKSYLRMARFTEECAAKCAITEQMTPIFARRLWTQFHKAVLATVPETLLRTTDYGLHVAWSGFTHEMNMSSLVMLDTFAVHYDTRTYDRLLDAARTKRSVNRALRNRVGKSSYTHLYQTFPHLMAAATCKDRKSCYSRPQ
jgi:hypothetical protein